MLDKQRYKKNKNYMIYKCTNSCPSEYFEDNSDHCGGFVLQCRVAFNWPPNIYASEKAKITYSILSVFLKYYL